MHSDLHSPPARLAWLLPAETLCFLCGICLGRSALSWPSLLAGAALSLLAAGLSRRKLRAGALLLTILSVGGLLGWQAYHPRLPEEGEYLVRGTVTQEMALREDGQLQTVLSGVTLNGIPWGNAWWTCYLDEGEAPPDWLVPGAQLEMTATVYHPAGQENPSGFNFQEYLLQRNIRFGLYSSAGLTPAEGGFSLPGWLAAVRHRLSLRLMAVMGDDAGAYAAAMLLGTRDFIPEDDRAAFADLGIAHILSISGYHVAVLAGLLALLLRPLPLGRKGRLAVEAVILLGYSLLTGGQAPVIRAALLLLWRGFTRIRHRQVLPLHLLCVTALVQLLFNPTLLASASFQLTYSAMLGLLLVFPRLKRQRVCRTRLGRTLWEAFCAALSTQLGVLFPQLYWFGRLPLLSILLNMAVMPLTGCLMGLYWFTLAALPLPGLRELAGLLSGTATRLLLCAVRTLAAQHFATLWVRQADLFAFIGWALLIFATSSLLPRRLCRHRRKLLLAGGLLVALIFVSPPETTVTYTQFSVGNADAAVLQDRDMTVVIDAGENGQPVAGYLHRQRQAVEALIITHLHTDHAGGVRALLDEGIPVETCYLPADADVPLIDAETLPLLAELAQTGTQFVFLHRGDTIPLPSGQLTVLWPEAGRISALHDANDVCLVLQAEIAGTTLLLTGDLPGAYEMYAALPSDVLKAAHHGSKESTSTEFLSAVAPQLILLSNRSESRETHMAEVAGEIPLYATGRDGAVILRFLGDEEFTVETVK